MKRWAMVMVAVVILSAGAVMAAPAESRFKGNIVYVGRTASGTWGVFDIAQHARRDCLTVWVVLTYPQVQAGPRGPVQGRRSLVRFCKSARTRQVLAKTNVGPEPRRRIYGVLGVNEKPLKISPNSIWDRIFRKIFTLRLDCQGSCLRQCLAAADESPPPDPVAACLKKNTPPSGLRPPGRVPEGIVRMCRDKWRAICQNKCRVRCQETGGQKP